MMKIKCLFNNGSVLPENIYRTNKYDRNTLFNVTLNKEYIVYGIATIKKFSWFLICDDTYDGTYINYPLYLPRHLFEIVDGVLSKHWIAAESLDEYDNNEVYIQFGFKELIKEKYFYGNLVEGGIREVKVFQDYKALMDSE